MILGGCIIQPETFRHYSVDQNLNFLIHTEYICKKATRQLSGSRRLSCYFENKAKLALSRAFILIHFQYCSAVWYHCSAPNTRCMENIQERALKCVYFNHNASYESLLNKARLPSLKVGRQMNIAILTFKILNGINSFCFLAPKIWNSMLEALRIIRDPKIFHNWPASFFFYSIESII